MDVVDSKRSEPQQPFHPNAHRYRPEIDGLRAVAVIAVLINHLNPAWLPSGCLGATVS